MARLRGRRFWPARSLRTAISRCEDRSLAGVHWRRYETIVGAKRPGAFLHCTFGRSHACWRGARPQMDGNRSDDTSQGRICDCDGWQSRAHLRHLSRRPAVSDAQAGNVGRDRNASANHCRAELGRGTEAARTDEIDRSRCSCGYNPTAFNMSLTAGSKLGAYEIIGPLGAGGQGEVYKATDTRLNRAVAVKILPQSSAQSPDVKQ